MDIPLPEAYVSPMPAEIGESLEGGYPGWSELSQVKKLAVIEQVISQEVRPYIELDGGGVELVDLIEGREVIIAYQGNCTSCFSSTGATLSYIQQVLRAKISQDLVVVPDFGEGAPWQQADTDSKP
jgi:NifU-like protein